MKKIVSMLLFCIFLSGCATPLEMFKMFLGNSTKELEGVRKDAAVKVFDYDYKTCYGKAEGVLKSMPNVSIYAKNNQMIALYYLSPDTTPVGLFFTEVDPTHTRVEISSLSTVAKDWVAKNIFSETALDTATEKPIIKTHTGPVVKDLRLGN